MSAGQLTESRRKRGLGLRTGPREAAPSRLQTPDSLRSSLGAAHAGSALLAPPAESPPPPARGRRCARDSHSRRMRGNESAPSPGTHLFIPGKDADWSIPGHLPISIATAGR